MYDYVCIHFLNIIYFRGTRLKPLNTLFLMSSEIIWIKVLKMTDLWASAVAHTVK